MIPFIVAIGSTIIGGLLIVNRAIKVEDSKNTASNDANMGVGCVSGILIGILWITILTWIYNEI